MKYIFNWNSWQESDFCWIYKPLPTSHPHYLSSLPASQPLPSYKPLNTSLHSAFEPHLPTFHLTIPPYYNPPHSHTSLTPVSLPNFFVSPTPPQIPASLLFPWHPLLTAIHILTPPHYLVPQPASQPCTTTRFSIILLTTTHLTTPPHYLCFTTFSHYLASLMKYDQATAKS